MAALEIKGLSKRFGETEVLKGIDLAIADGEFVVFVGPSGCGKSTLLRAIAGLEEIDAGEILIGGRPVAGLEPARRGVAMVFQSYALYPHMSVRANMGFALKLAGAPQAEIEVKVAKAAEMLNIGHLLDRKPAALSGGQRQRVAIGRAIVRNPEIFLFDEPLSNLDTELRVRMRFEFAKLHKELGATMVYVTHDQIEAMTLADRIVVLNGGRIEQIGAPLELYRDPASQFVAGFVGSPRMNMIPSGQATLGIRPEHIALRDVPGQGRVSAKIVHVEQIGHIGYIYAEADCSDQPLVIQAPANFSPQPGQTVALDWADADSFLFDAQGRRISAA